MGNRAVIMNKDMTLGIYVHWNGGIDSVTAFLKYCDLAGYRGFPDDYGVARLAQVIGNWFGSDGLSVGITSHPLTWIGGCDNGGYIVEGWKIVKHVDVEDTYDNDGELIDRKVVDFPYDNHEGYDLLDMLLSIDECQPYKLGGEFIKKAIGG